MADCRAFDPESPYVVALTSFIDCQGRSLGQEGYAALASSSSPIAMAIGVMITILIAIFGYRLILNDDVQVRDGLTLIVRVGIVLALATQWAAYQRVIYDVAIDGPAELASAILRADETSFNTIPDRVQRSYDALELLAHPRLGFPGAAAGTVSSTAPAAVPIRLTTAEQGRLSASSVVLLLSSLAALLSVRIIIGIMLALGPLFIACLLFDNLRGLFEGWVRVLAGAAIGSISATVALELELAVLEPQLKRLLDAVAAQQMPATGAIEVFVTTLLFSAIFLALLVAAAKAAAGFRLFRTRPLARADAQPVPANTIDIRPATSRTTQHEVEPSVVMMHHSQSARPTKVAASTTNMIDPSRRIVAPHSSTEATTQSFEPLSASHRPRRATRRSATAVRRDRRA